MAIPKPKKAYVYNAGELYPANIYSRPATPVWNPGMNDFGKAQRYNAERYGYSIKQMAVSPFSVNNKLYMERIREQYADDSLYNTMGTVGGVVGAGVGAMYSAGALNFPKFQGSKNIFKTSTWTKDNLKWNDIWTGNYNPKHTARRQFFQHTDYSVKATTYNKTVDALTDAKSIYENAATTEKTLKETRDTAYKTWKYTRKKLKDIKATRRTAYEVAEKAYSAAEETLENAETVYKTASKTTDAAFDAVKAVGNVDDVVSGAKISAKASGLVPALGLGMDVLNLGLSSAELSMGIKSGNVLHTTFGALGVLGDVLDVTGDVLTMGGVTSIAGAALSLIGGVISIASSALIGALVGETVGHSMSPEGAKAQAMFAENLYSSTIHRPITATASILVMLGLPAATGYLSNMNTSLEGITGNALKKFMVKSTRMSGKVIQPVSYFLSQNALGNQVRAGISMLTLQGVSSITTKMEDKLRGFPDNPDDVNFVSAISVYGDINDNLYGATRNKSILVGLAANDPYAMTEAFARSWGRSDEIYKSVSFDDVREPLGIDLGPIGNSIISTIGELVIDPQNFNEFFEGYNLKKAAKLPAQLLRDRIKLEQAIALTQGGKAKDGSLGKLIDENGIFRNASPEAIKLQLERFANAYLAKGPEGLSEVLATVYASTHKGHIVGEGKSITLEAREQSKILQETFEQIYDNKFNYKVGTAEERAILNKNIQQYKKIKNMIDNKADLSEEETKIKSDVENTFKILIDKYGKEDNDMLVHKFMNEFDLKFDQDSAYQYYLNHRDLNHHMNIADNFARTINMVANPASKLVQTAFFSASKLAAHARSTLVTDEQKAKEIIKLKELSSTRIKPYTIADVKAAKKEEDLRYGYASEDIPKIIENLPTETTNEIQVAKEEHAIAKEIIAGAKKELDDIAEDYKNRRDTYMAQSTEYTYTLYSEPVYVNKESRDYVTEFEKDHDVNNLTRADKKTEAYRRYKATKSAILDYDYHNIYFDQVSDVVVRLKSGLIMLDTLTAQANEETIALLYLVNNLKKYVNHLDQKKSGKKIKGTRTYKDEDWRELEEALNNSKSPTYLLMLKYNMLPELYYEGKLYKGLEAIKISAATKQILTFSFKGNINYKISSIIYSTLLSTDTEYMLKGITKIPANMNKDAWKKWSMHRQYKEILGLLETLDFTPEEHYKITRDSGVIKAIHDALDAYFYGDQRSYEAILLEDLNENKLKAIVASKLFKKTETRSMINKTLEYFKTIDKEIKKTTELFKEDDFQQRIIKDIIKNQIDKFEYNLTNSVAYDFIKAYIKPTVVTTDKELGLFMSEEGTTLLKNIITKKDIEDAKNKKDPYKEENLLKAMYNHPIMNYAKKQTEGAFEQITNNKSIEDMTDEEIIIAVAKEEAAIEDSKVRGSTSRAKADIKRSVNKEAALRLPGIENLKLEDINNIEIKATVTESFMKKSKFIKSSYDPKSEIINKTLRKKIFNLQIENVYIDIHPSMFTDGKSMDKKDFKNYMYVTDKLNADTSGHSEFLSKAIDHLLNIPDIEIYKKTLVKVPINKKATDKETLKKRMLATYKKGKAITIIAKYEDSAKVTKTFTKSVYRSVVEYMKENKDILLYERDAQDDYSKKTIDKFIEDLIESKDTVLKNKIFDSANEIFQNNIRKGNYIKGQSKFNNIADKLLTYEQKSLRGITNRYYSLATDVFKRLVFGDNKTGELLDDIMTFKTNKEGSKYNTSLFTLLQIIDEHVSTDFRHKRNFKVGNVTDITRNKNGEINIYIKDRKKPMGLFELVYKYKFSLHSYINFLQKVGNAKAKDGADIKDIIEITSTARQEYYNMTNKFAGIISHDVLDIDEELFFKQGGTKEELEILRDVDTAILYNNLKLKDVLETSKKTEHYKLMPVYYTDEVKKAIDTAERMYNNKTIKVIYGVEKSKMSLEDVILIHILRTSGIDEDTKRILVRDIFFNGYRVTAVKAGETYIEDAKKTLAEYKRQQALAKDTTSLDIKIASIEDKINKLEEQITTVENRDMRLSVKGGFDNFYKYLLQDMNRAVEIFNNVIYSDSNEYVVAKDPDINKSYVIKKYDANGELNVIDKSEGIPSKNAIIGEDIIKRNDTNLIKNFDKTKLEGTPAEGGTLVAYSDKGLIIVSDKKLTDVQLEKGLLKEALGISPDKDLYILTKEQYSDIIKMMNEHKYTAWYAYEAIKEKGVIKGKVQNIINVSARKAKVDAYLDDMRLFKNVNEEVKTLQKYAEVFHKNIVVNKAYISNVAYSKSEHFNNLYGAAKTNKAFYDFMSFLDPKRSKTFYTFNVQKIADEFFKKRFIKEQDGKFYNTSNLEKDITDIQLRKDLKTISIDGESLYSIVQKAIVLMQQKYGSDPDIILNMANVGTDNFFTSVKDISRQAEKILQYFKKTNKVLYEKIIPSLEAKQKDGTVTSITVEEIKDRNKLTNTFSKELYNDDGRYLQAFANYDGDKKSKYNNGEYKNHDYVREKAITQLKDNLKRKNEYGETYSTIMYSMALKERKFHKDRVALINKSRKNKKRSGLNYSTWKALSDYFEEVIKAQKENRSPLDFKKFFNFYSNEGLDKAAGLLYKRYVNLKEELLTADEIKAAEIKKKLGYLATTTWVIDSKKDMYNYIVIYMLGSYIRNVEREIKPRDKQDIINQNIFSVAFGGSSEEAGKKIEDAFKEEELRLKNRSWKLLDSYRMVTKNVFVEKDGQYTLNEVSTPIEIATYNDLFLGTGVNNKNIKETLVEVMNDVEAILFGEPSQADINFFQKDTKLNKPQFKIVSEFIDSFPKEQQDMIKLIIKYIPSTKAFTSDNLQNLLAEDGVKIEKGTVTYKGLDLIIPDELYKQMYEIKTYQRTSKYTFKDTYEIYKLLAMPLLNEDEGFKNYLKEKLFDNSGGTANSFLASLGFKTVQDRNMFNNYNLQQIIYTMKDADPNDVIAFVLVTNMYKKMYLAQEYNKKYISGENKYKTFSMADAVRDYRDEPLASVVKDIKQINKAQGFDYKAHNNIITKMYEETNFIFEALAYTETQNKLLGSVVLSSNEKINEVIRALPVYVLTKESNILTMQRNVQRNIYQYLFKENEGGFYGRKGTVNYELQKSWGDAVLDFATEKSASTLEEAKGTSKIYNDLRENFTNLLVSLDTEKYKKDFIKIMDIGSALSVLLNSKDQVAFYKSAFKSYINVKFAGKQETHDAYKILIKNTLNFFKSSSALVPMNEDLLLAIIGYIGQHKYNIIEKDSSQFIQKIIEHTKGTELYKHDRALSSYDHISYELTITRDPDDLAKVIYDKQYDELDKEEKKVFKEILNLQRLISSGLFIDPLRKYDTLDYMTYVSRELYFEESTANQALGEAKAKLYALKNNIPSQKGVMTKFKNKYGYKTDKDVQEALDELNGEVNKTQIKLDASAGKLEKLKEIKNNEKIKVVNNIIAHTPELAEQFLVQKEEEIEKNKVTLTKLEEAFNKKYKEEIRKAHSGRLSNLRIIKDYFSKDPEYIMYSILEKIEADENVYFLFKNELESFKIKNYAEFRKWLSKMQKHVTELRKEEHDLKKPIKVDDKNILIKSLETDQKEIDTAKVRYLKSENYKPNSVEDVFLEVKIRIVNQYFKEILKELETDEKIRYTKMFKEAKIEQISADRVSAMKKILNTKMEKQIKDIETNILPGLKTLGLYGGGKYTIDSTKALLNGMETTLVELDKKLKDMNKLQNAKKYGVKYTKLQKDYDKQKELFELEVIPVLLSEGITSRTKNLTDIGYLAALKKYIDSEDITDVLKEELIRIQKIYVAFNSIAKNYNKNESLIKEVLKTIADANVAEDDIKSTFEKKVKEYIILSKKRSLIKNYKKQLIAKNDIIQNNIKILEAIKNSTVKTREELIIQTAHKLFKDNEINEKSILMMASYLAGDNVKEFSKDIKDELAINEKINEVIKKLKEEQEAHKEFFKKKDKIETDILESMEMTDKIHVLDERLDNSVRISKIQKLEEESIKATAMSKLDEHYTNKNIGAFKKYNKIDPDTKDDVVIDMVLETTAKDMLILEGKKHTKQDIARRIKTLEKDISNGGDKEVHNDVVDVLITRLNYIYQMKDDVPKEFTVLDMETVKDSYGNTPYKMTLLKQTSTGITIMTTYISNRVFHLTEATDVDGLLEEFYLQQRDMYKNTELTEEEIDKKTKDLIELIKTKSNHIEFVNTFITELNAKKDTPIIAHNGKRFDFGNYDKFLKNYAQRLLKNLYYHEIKKSDPDKLRQRLSETSPDIDRHLYHTKLTELYTKAVDKTLNKLNNNEIVTREELDQLDKLNDARAAVKITTAFEKAALQSNILTPTELYEDLYAPGPDSAITKVKDLVYKYITTNRKDIREQARIDLIDFYSKGYEIETDITAKEDIAAIINNLLKNATKTYEELRSGKSYINYTKLSSYNTKKNRIIRHIKEGIIDKVEVIREGSEPVEGDYIVSKSYNNYVAVNKEIDQHIKFLLQNDERMIEHTIEVYEQEKIKQQEESEEALKEIEILKGKLKGKINSKEEILDKMLLSIEKIQKATKNPTYIASTKISTYLRKKTTQQEDVYSDASNTGLLRLRLSQQQQAMNSSLDDLQRFKKYIITMFNEQTEEKDLKKFISTFNSPVVKEMFEIKSNEDKLKLKIKYTKMIKKLKETKTTYVNEIKELRKSTKDNIDAYYNYLKELWESKETKDLGIKMKFNIKNKYSIKEYIPLYKELMEHTNVRDELHFIDLLVVLDTNSTFNKLLKMHNTKDNNELMAMESVKKLLESAVNKDIEMLNARIATLNNIDVTGNLEARAYNVISELFNKHLAEINVYKESVKDIENINIFNVLRNKGLTSSEMNPKQLIAAASRKLDKDLVESIGNSAVKRAYGTVQDNDIKRALIMNPEKIYMTRTLISADSELITLYVYDKYHDNIQKLSFSTISPNKVTLEIDYRYTTKDKPLTQQSPRIKKISNIYEEFDPYGLGSATKKVELKSAFKKLFEHRNKKGILGGMDPNNILKIDGADQSYEAINKLVKFYDDNKAVFNSFDSKKDSFDFKFAKILEQVVEDQNIQLEDLVLLNMDEELQNAFIKQMEILQYAKRGDKFIDPNKIYAGIADKLLGKFNALVPGKILNMIPETFSSNFIIKYTDASLKKHNIILEHTSEGSAGSSFMLRNFAHITLPFRHSTNTIRSVLSNPKLYSTYTPIGIINDMYVKEDSDPGKDFMDYLQTDNQILKELLIKKYKNKKVNVFTPNVVTDEMKTHYDNDVLHKIGINLQVAFANDPRANEDTILMDEDDALELAWGAGNKTWIGLYGFKGAVILVKGLRDTYGATFVAEADSIEKRGAGGVLIEMAHNVIRQYFTGDHSQITDSALKLLNKHKDELIKLYTITEDGKIIVDQGIDYDKVLNKINKNFVTKLITDTISKDCDIETFIASENNKIITNIKGNKMYRGEVYVMLDSEHTAEDMANKAQIKSYGDLHYVLKDYKSSVRSGVVISPSVVYTMLSKGNIDWKKAFPADYSKVELYTNTLQSGAEYILEMYGVKSSFGYDIQKTLKNIEANTKSKNITDVVREYLMYLHSSNNTKEDTAYKNTHLEFLNKKLKQIALDSLTSRHGAYYKAAYKKHPGIRQQLVANTSLGLGEINSSIEGFIELIKMKDNWLQEDVDGVRQNVSKEKTKEILNQIELFKKEHKESIKPNDTVVVIKYKEHMYTSKVKEYIASLNVYGYVMAVRSPVQDYNATPIMKITGVTSHHAVEANAYLYAMIGGDNDGDTIGMAALDYDQFEALAPKNSDGVHEGLNASNKDYYDKNYFEDIEKSLVHREIPEMNSLAAIRMYAGKKTFKKNTRKEYSWDELYIIAYGETVKNYISNIKVTGKIKEEFLANTNLVTKYASVIYRKIHKGLDEDFSLSDIKMYIDNDDILEEMIQRYLFDIEVKEGKFKIEEHYKLTKDNIEQHKDDLSNKDKALLKDISIEDFIISTSPKYLALKEKILFNMMYRHILYNTINRIQVSKRGVNIMGGNRKKQLVASLLSTFPHINTDASGDAWNKFRDFEGNLTVESIKNTISKTAPKITFENVVIKSKEVFINSYKDIKYDGLIKKDFELILSTVYDQYKNARDTITELTLLGNALRSNNIAEFKNYLNTSVSKDNHILKSMYRRISKVSSDLKLNNVLTKVDKQLLKILYFGRFDKTGDDFFKLVSNKKSLDLYIDTISKQYINQHIIDRREFNKLSQKASEIISVAKHFGIDIDAIEYLKEYTKQVTEITEKNSIKHIAITPEEQELNIAIAMDKNTFELDNILIDDSVLKKLKEDNKYEKPEFKQSYRGVKEKTVHTDINKIIDDMVAAELFGDPFAVKTSYYKNIKNVVLRTMEIFKEERNIYAAAERIEKEIYQNDVTLADYLTINNVPLYRLDRVMTNALSFFININNIYFRDNKKTLDISEIDYLKNVIYLYETSKILNSRQEKENLRNNSDSFPKTAKILLNENEVDPDLIIIDDEGYSHKLTSSDIDTSNLLHNVNNSQVALSNVMTVTGKQEFGDIYDKLVDLSKKAFDNTLNKLNLISSKESETIESILQEMVNDFSISNVIHKDISETKVNKKRTKENVLLSIANKYAFSYHNMSEYIHKITKDNNEVKSITKELEELIKKINRIELEIASSKNKVRIIDLQKEYFEGLISREQLISKLTNLKEENLFKLKKIKKHMSDYSFNLNFEDASVLLHNGKGQTRDKYYQDEPKLLEQKDVNQLKNYNLLNMDKFQTPFIHMIEFWGKEDKYGEIKYNWDAMFKWYKANRRNNRLTIVMKAFDDETLIKKLTDYIRIEDENTYGKDNKLWKDLTYKEQQKHKKERYNNTKIKEFNNVEDLQKFMEELGADNKKIKYKGKVYKGAESSLDLTQHISPTLKEIDINSAEDLQNVLKFIEANEGVLIGFSDLNSTMSAMEQAYKPYRHTGKFADVIGSMQQLEKLMLRYSVGFLFRNFVDTWNQLMSHMYMEQGANGIVRDLFTDNKKLVKYFAETFEIYGLYKTLSEERLLVLTLVETKYVDILKVLKKPNISTKEFDLVKNNVTYIYEQLTAYVDVAKDLDKENESTKRITKRLDKGEELIADLKNLKDYLDATDEPLKNNIVKLHLVKQRKSMKAAVTFLLNVHFSEFFLMHDKMQPVNNSSARKINKIKEKYKKKGDQEYTDFKQIMFEIGVFMQSNAQVDQYKSDEYKKLHELVAEQKIEELESNEDLSYEKIVKKIKKQKQKEFNIFEKLVGNNVYEVINEDIENSGRIGGYLFDRYINGYTQNETINKSLNRFFNYGMRTPLEINLLADIPYLSFPIRSINNWIERLTDPGYLRIMSDIVDGMYSQYADDDGQYDEFTKFQIINGWLPMFGKIGLRYGNGLFDIQSILSSPSQFFEERGRPLIRGILTLLKTKDIETALKETAVAGVLGRAATTLGPRELMQETPLIKDLVSKRSRSIATTVSGTFEHFDYNKGYGYGKYVPYKYRSNNGRYARYENIYKNWFNKYGRMRQPRVDPVGIVKDIQWQQYVRYRQGIR